MGKSQASQRDAVPSSGFSRAGKRGSAVRQFGGSTTLIQDLMQKASRPSSALPNPSTYYLLPTAYLPTSSPGRIFSQSQ